MVGLAASHREVLVMTEEDRARDAVALLRAAGQPVTVRRVCDVSGCGEEAATAAVREGGLALVAGGEEGGPFAAAPQDAILWGEAEETARATALRTYAWQRRAGRATPWAVVAATFSAVVVWRRPLLAAVRRAWIQHMAPLMAQPTTNGLSGVVPTWHWPHIWGLAPRIEGAILLVGVIVLVWPGNRVLRVGVLLCAVVAGGALWHLVGPVFTRLH